MSRAFAMWIEDASALRVRGPQVLLRGSPLGPAPEARDALVMHAPFSRPLRVHCKSVLSHPRGAEDARFAFGIDAELGLEARQCIGAVIVDEGVAVRAFTARLRAPSTPHHAPARFDLGRDRAWGLIAVRRHLLNIVVVGGGLAAAEDFWARLQRIEPQGFVALEPAMLERVSVPFALDGGAWEIPTLRTYAQGDERSALVIPSTGPVTVASAKVFVDGDWRDSDLYQQADGLTQIMVESGPGMDTTTVVASLSAA
jgi:hypothetical protein